MKNTRLIILFFTMVVVMLGFGIIIPIIPFYVEEYGASGTELGMLMATFSFMQFLFAPLWGGLSDRFGRKGILVIGAFGNALSHLIFGLSTGLPMMFLSRALAGILSSATIPTALAYISDSTDENKRGGGMGLIGAAMGVGMVLGPGLGGILGKGNLSLPFFLASGLSMLALLLILVILPESLPPEARGKDNSPIRGPQVAQMWKALFGPLGIMLALSFLINFALANFEGIFGLFSASMYDYGPEQVGSVLTVVGLVSAVIQGIITGPAIRRLGEEMVIKLSLLSSAIGFLLMLAARSDTLVFLTVGYFVMSNAMLRPSLASLISKRSSHGFGQSLGLSAGYESLGRVVGPLYAGFMLDINLVLPYASAAVIMVAAFFLACPGCPDRRSPNPTRVIS